MSKFAIDFSSAKRNLSFSELLVETETFKGFFKTNIKKRKHYITDSLDLTQAH